MKLNMNLDLGSSSAGAADWVKTSRVKEKESIANAKRQAALKQKQLDEEEEEMLEQSRGSTYSASDLKGLKVMHSANDFEAGEDVVLTLADTSILETDEHGKIIGLNEEGDMLENVNIADKDRRLDREKKKRRLNQPIYSALDDYEFQEGVAPGTKAPLLPQYEKDKKSAPSLELGEGGTLNLGNLVNLTSGSDSAKGASAVSSLKGESKLASDYYSASEIKQNAKFKKSHDSKSKKKRSTRKKSLVDDEEETPSSTEVIISNNSQAGGGGGGGMDVALPGAAASTAAGTAEGVKTESKVMVKAPMQFQSIDLDEDDPDMANALARARKLALQKQRKEDAATAAVAEGGDSMQVDDDGGGGGGDGGGGGGGGRQSDAVLGTDQGKGQRDRGAAVALSLAMRAKEVEDYLKNKSSVGSIHANDISSGQSSGGGSSGVADGDEDIDTDGRRSDGTLIFNSTTEFSTRLQARLNDKARLKTEAMVKQLERSATEAMSKGHHQHHQLQRKRGMSMGQDDDYDGAGVDAAAAASFAATESKGGGDGDDDAVMDVDVDNVGTGAMAGAGAAVDDDEALSDEEEMMMMLAQEQQGGNASDDDDDIDDEQMEFVHRQPLANKGMAAALALLKGSGELRKADELAGRAKDNRAQDPSKGDFGVKLEYRDEFGRKLTQKEAFRQLSYRFHGYGPGKKKKEKRLKAVEVANAATTSRASVLDGAGGTMKSLTQAQQATGKAHVTIQGGVNTSVVAPSTLAAAMLAKKGGTGGAGNKNGGGSSSTSKKK